MRSNGYAKKKLCKVAIFKLFISGYTYSQKIWQIVRILFFWTGIFQSRAKKTALIAESRFCNLIF